MNTSQENGNGCFPLLSNGAAADRTKRNSLPLDKKYFVYLDCVDGRNGLARIVRGELQYDSACGDVFIFLKRS